MFNYRIPDLTFYLGISWFFYLCFFGLVWFGSLWFARIASASDVMPWERFVDRSIWLVVGISY